MRITSISIMERANLGNYEHVEFKAEAVIDEDDKAGAVTETLRDFVNWHAQRNNRDAKRDMFLKELENPEIKDARKASLERWLQQYDERKARMEAM